MSLRVLRVCYSLVVSCDPYLPYQGAATLKVTLDLPNTAMARYVNDASAISAA
jgi:hypothetical protein